MDAGITWMHRLLDCGDVTCLLIASLTAVGVAISLLRNAGRPAGLWVMALGLALLSATSFGYLVVNVLYDRFGPMDGVTLALKLIGVLGMLALVAGTFLVRLPRSTESTP